MNGPDNDIRPRTPPAASWGKKSFAAILALLIGTGADLPQTGPTPAAKPGMTAERPAREPAADLPTDRAKDNRADGEAGPALSIAAEDADAYAACLKDLEALGATAEPAARIDDGQGCGIDRPVTLTEIRPGVALEPKGTMRCETALELARWTDEFVIPAGRAALPGDTLVAVEQASTYVCRLRNGASTGKISEHARGNAVDIAGFRFASGKTIGIEKRREDATLAGAFQRSVSATACLRFTTVLDPESDAAHEDHLHLDVLARRNGYRYCR
ncbi:extensin-like domain-containing protein [Ensifer soli]|uniref:extensin-like domain-containing protein n=1 Tax=Ciceribacter sp. sgz301302 TaxID=3342379 RepID=UPI0035B7ECC5